MTVYIVKQFPVGRQLVVVIINGHHQIGLARVSSHAFSRRAMLAGRLRDGQIQTERMAEEPSGRESCYCLSGHGGG